jgi:stringent starvation protein B
MIDTKDTTSTRPYLIRALYEWCTDNGLTPYVAVLVDDSVRVPNEYVKDGEIVLNISFDATSALKLGNEFIEFKARFAGSAREIMVPISRVIAIYARENGQGMSFPMSVSQGNTASNGSGSGPASVSVGGGTGGNTGPAALTSVPSSNPTLIDKKGDAKVVQLSPGAPTSAPPDTKPPRPPSGPRPALKRVK